MKLLKDIDVSGKRVLVRADLDVEITNYKFQITKPDEMPARLLNIKPTVDYLISHNAKQIIIAGHIGRPENRRVGEIGGIGKSEISDESESQMNQKVRGPDFYDEKLSTKHLVAMLEKILGQKSEFSPDVILRPKVEESQNRSFAGAQDDKIGVEPLIVLLENLRFWPGEEKNDPEFARQLASLADVYINEAFGVCHRAHASIVGVPGLLPHAAGLHLEEEVNQLTKLIGNPQRPMVAIIGGAKLETKVPVIDAMAKVADTVLIGGLVAQQLKIRKTSDVQSQNTSGMNHREHFGNESSGMNQVGTSGNVMIANLTLDEKDIDVESIEKFSEIIKGAKTVVWNGPVGLFEEGFERGTLAIAQAVIESGVYSVIGGGETTEFLGSKKLLSKFSFVSSGGGAMLEFLSGKELPGIKALS